MTKNNEQLIAKVSDNDQILKLKISKLKELCLKKIEEKREALKTMQLQDESKAAQELANEQGLGKPNFWAEMVKHGLFSKWDYGLDLMDANSQIFERLDAIDIARTQDQVRTLCTRFAVWRDTLELAMDEATICLRLLQEQIKPTDYQTIPININVCQKFFHTLMECGLDEAACFMSLKKFTMKKEQ